MNKVFKKNKPVITIVGLSIRLHNRVVFPDLHWVIKGGEFWAILGDNGSGKGNTGQTGNQGNSEGDPNAKNLEGIHAGAGQVDAGLGSRGVLTAPRLTDTSQKTGKVRIKVCLDGDGNVMFGPRDEPDQGTSPGPVAATARQLG